MTEPQSPDARPQPYAAPVVGRSNPAGTISFIIGLVLVALGLILQVVNPLIPQILADTGSSVSDIAGVFAVFSIVTGIIAIPGVITGVIGIQPSRPRGRLAAAAGLALSAAQLLGVLFGFVTSAVYSVM